MRARERAATTRHPTCGCPCSGSPLGAAPCWRGGDPPLAQRLLPGVGVALVLLAAVAVRVRRRRGGWLTAAAMLLVAAGVAGVALARGQAVRDGPLAAAAGSAHWSS